uniref:NADH dehydrogenase subunit 2 n=1 Tax=Ammophila clavus TaxID=2594619 RepID=UPI0030014E02
MYLYNMKMISISIFILLNSFSMLFLNSMFNMWIMMEFNSMMIFIMMFYFDSNKMKIILYMLIQVFSSSVLMFSFYLMNSPHYFSSLGELMMLSSLSLKLAMFPFHSWYPYINKGLSWPMIFFMTTFQKLGPMILFSYTHSMILLNITLNLTAVISTINMMYSNSMKAMMSYSSLIHTSWMIMIMILSNSSFFIYFIIYSLLTFTIFLMFHKLNLMFINQKFMISNLMNFSIFLLLLSYSSLPPFTGFILKWIVVKESNNIFYSLTFMLMLASCSAMFMYTKSTMQSIMSSNFKTWISYEFSILQSYLIFIMICFPMLGLTFMSYNFYE